MQGALMPRDERDFYNGHAAGDVAATYAENLATTLSTYIERIPNPAPPPVPLVA
jgi:hypothetical protein